MQPMEMVKTHKVKIIAGAATMTALVVISAFVLPLFASAADNQGQTVYKETKVTRGDITTGVTESGTATLEAVSISYPIAGTVEEILVKAGQSVQEGDVIAKLEVDSVEQTIAQKNLEYEKAKVKLQQALIDQQLSQIDAKYTYEENIASGEIAEDQYTTTMNALQKEISSAEDSLEELDEQIDDYEDQIDGGLYSQYNIKGLKDQITQLNTQLDHANAGTCADADCSYTSHDPAEIQALIEAAQKAYDTAYAQYVKAYEDAETKLKSAKNEYSTTKLKYQQSSTNFEIEELKALAEMEQTQTTAEKAQLLYQIEIAQINNNVTSEQLNVKTIELELEELNEKAGNGEVVATCAGLVMTVNCKAGDTVNAGAAIATIANSENVYIDVSIAQEDIADIAIDKLANLSFSAYPETKYTGAVDSISVAAARGSSTVSYTVSVKLDGDGSKIYEGMTADVTFVTKELKGVLYVSNKAVFEENGTEYVKVKDTNGDIRTVEVQTGFSDGRNVEITSGLTEGETAVIESQVSLK